MPALRESRSERLQANPEEELIMFKFASQGRGFRIRAKSAKISEALKKLANGRTLSVRLGGVNQPAYAVDAAELQMPESRCRVRYSSIDSLGGNQLFIDWILLVALGSEEGVDVTLDFPTTKEQRENYAREFLKWVKNFYSAVMLEEEVEYRVTVVRG